jgi:hypothetical protein
MVATSGVSASQVNVLGTVWLPGLTSRANNWSSKPTGSGTSEGVRPENWMVLPTGTGTSGLQAPKLAAPRLQTLLALRDSEVPTGAEDCSAPMSTDSRPAAGPLVALSVPS